MKKGEKAMRPSEELKSKLYHWLAVNILNVSVSFDPMPTIYIDREFSYDQLDCSITLGWDLRREDLPEAFNNWLLQHGLIWGNLPYPMLAFLHEVGHYKTLDCISLIDLHHTWFIKGILAYRDNKDIDLYWDTPDEYAANMWLINFANSHEEAINELGDIFCNYWNDAIDEATLPIRLSLRGEPMSLTELRKRY